MSKDRCVHVEITGLVQGVGFRYWTRGEAMARNLSGWVRNLPDGTVEAVFCGPAEAVSEMIEACRTGPGPARVTDVSVSEETREPPGTFTILN